MLGLAERERKVFLSYLRRESTPLAIQLHTALAQARFDVFLDRFTVDPGEDFQARLDEDLGDKAFVTVLESPGIRTSKWVQHEIAYAQSHRIGVVALTLPGTADDQLFPTVDDAFRLRLTAADMLGDELTQPRLSDVINLIQTAHARELRRRREQLLGSLRDTLVREGCTCDPVADWAMVAEAPGHKPAISLLPSVVLSLKTCMTFTWSTRKPKQSQVIRLRPPLSMRLNTSLRTRCGCWSGLASQDNSKRSCSEDVSWRGTQPCDSA